MGPPRTPPWIPSSIGLLFPAPHPQAPGLQASAGPCVSSWRLCGPCVHGGSSSRGTECSTHPRAASALIRLRAQGPAGQPQTSAFRLRAAHVLATVTGTCISAHYANLENRSPCYEVRTKPRPGPRGEGTAVCRDAASLGSVSLKSLWAGGRDGLDASKVARTASGSSSTISAAPSPRAGLPLPAPNHVTPICCIIVHLPACSVSAVCSSRTIIFGHSFCITSEDGSHLSCGMFSTWAPTSSLHPSEASSEIESTGRWHLIILLQIHISSIRMDVAEPFLAC